MAPQSPAHTPSEAPLAGLSDARLHALTEHALEIITVQDEKGRFTYANEATARYLGYSAQELLGQNAYNFMHPDDQVELNDRFRALLSCNGASTEHNRFEYRFRHK